MIEDSLKWKHVCRRRDFIARREIFFCHAIKKLQESPADAVKPARRKSMQKLLQFDVFRFISPNSISPNFKV